MKHLSILTAIILAAAALMASFQNCYACTGITLKAKDGSTVVARTIEWAASDNDCRWVVVPRGHRWKSFIPGGGTGRSFTNEYGYVGVSVVQDELMMEGMNEKGLSAGLFYFPDYGKYEEYSEANYETNISDFQLVSYILGRCATVDEVKAEIARVHTMDSIHVHRPYIGGSPSRQAARLCWRSSMGSAFSMKTIWAY